MKKINWLDHLANLLVVILGISIAFYLEGYREEKVIESQEKLYLEGLLEDLEADLQLLDTLIPTNEIMYNSISSLARSSTGAPYNEDSLVIHFYITQYNPAFRAQVTTYESLKSTGKMELITDYELRRKIINLYEQQYKGIETYDEVIEENLKGFFKPYYFEKIIYRTSTLIEDDFLQDSQFRNIIWAYRFLYGQKKDYYKTVREKLVEIIGQLENQK